MRPRPSPSPSWGHRATAKANASTLLVAMVLAILMTGWTSSVMATWTVPSIPSFNTRFASLEPMDAATGGWFDYNNDGLLDFIVSGRSNQTVGWVKTELWRNINGSYFVQVDNSSLANVYNAAVEWTDYDRDEDIDLFLSGSAGDWQNSTVPFSAIYRNDAGQFVRLNLALQTFISADAVWFDLDNDGDDDLYVTGQSSLGNLTNRIYRNDGEDRFVSVPHGILASDPDQIAAADYNGDGWTDLVITCRNCATIAFYVNKWGSLQLSSTNVSLARTAAAFADADNDYDLDVLISGGDDCDITAFYLLNNNNPPNNSFTDTLSTIATMGAAGGHLGWADFNSDYSWDAFLTQPQGNAVIFSNVNNTFHNNYSASIFGAERIYWADADNDLDVDYLAINTPWCGLTSMVVGNDGNQSLVAPPQPLNLTATWDETTGLVSIHWQRPPTTASLTYNVRVRNLGSGQTLRSAMATIHGKRLVAAQGNAGANENALVSAPPLQLIKIEVQSVDARFIGSTFANETIITTNISLGMCNQINYNLTERRAHLRNTVDLLLNATGWSTLLASNRYYIKQVRFVLQAYRGCLRELQTCQAAHVVGKREAVAEEEELTADESAGSASPTSRKREVLAPPPLFELDLPIALQRCLKKMSDLIKENGDLEDLIEVLQLYGMNTTLVAIENRVIQYKLMKLGELRDACKVSLATCQAAPLPATGKRQAPIDQDDLEGQVEQQDAASMPFDA